MRRPDRGGQSSTPCFFPGFTLPDGTAAELFSSDLIMSPDRYVGEWLDADWAAKPTSFQLVSTDDPRYQPGRQPKTVWRKTKPCDIGRVGPLHSWQFDCPTESVIYLDLPFALGNGHRYELRFQGRALSPVTLIVDTTRLRSEAVHVSHIGFHPADPVKVASPFLPRDATTSGAASRSARPTPSSCACGPPHPLLV